MRRLFPALLLLVLTGFAAAAQPLVRTERTPGGLEFRHSLLPNAQQQVVMMLWPDGTMLAGPAQSTLWAFGPTLFTEAPQGEKRGEINEQLKDLGGSFGARVTTNTTRFVISAPPAGIGATIDLAGRVLAAAQFTEKRFEALRQLRIKSAQQSLNDESTIANMLRLRREVAEPRFLDAMTVNPALFDGVRLADIEAWRRKVLTRDALVLATAGPLPAAEIGAALDRLVSVLPERGERPAPPGFRFRPGVKRIVLERDVAQTQIIAYGPTTIEAAPGGVLTELALSRLGGGAQGRLFRGLRDKLGATYGVSATVQAVSLERFDFTIKTAVSHDKAAVALDELATIYRQWWEEGVTEAEFQPAFRVARSRWQEMLKHPAQVAEFVANALRQGMDDDRINRRGEQRERATREAVNAFIKERLPPWPLAMVIVAPSAEGLGADCVIKALEEIDRCD